MRGLSLSVAVLVGVVSAFLSTPVPPHRHRVRVRSIYDPTELDGFLPANGHSVNGHSVNGHSVNGAKKNNMDNYSYANGAERQSFLHREMTKLSAAEDDADESSPPKATPPQFLPTGAAAPPPAAVPSTDDLKRQLILDAARELEKELAMAGEELQEARRLKLTASQLVDQGRIEAEKHWRGAVEELEKRAVDLGSELASLRSDQLRLQEEAMKDRAALQSSLDQVKLQLEAQQQIVATERDRSQKLETELKLVRDKQEITDRELSLEKLQFQRDLADKDIIITNQTAEITALKDQLSSSKTLARLLVKATCGDIASNRRVLATRVKNRLRVFNKLAAICACGSVIALAPILGPKLALTLGSVF